MLNRPGAQAAVLLEVQLLRPSYGSYLGPASGSSGDLNIVGLQNISVELLLQLTCTYVHHSNSNSFYFQPFYNIYLKYSLV